MEKAEMVDQELGVEVEVVGGLIQMEGLVVLVL